MVRKTNNIEEKEDKKKVKVGNVKNSQKKEEIKVLKSDKKNDKNIIKKEKKEETIKDKVELKTKDETKKVIEKEKNKVELNNMKRVPTFSLTEVIIVILMTSIVVATVTSIVVFKNYHRLSSTASYAKTDGLKEIENAYNNILNGYVDKVNPNDLANSAIDAMYRYLGDPYSSYINNDDTQTFLDRLKGEYYGIGIEFTKNENGLVVMGVFDGSPAKDADILPGDIMVMLNGEDITNLTASDLAKKIKSTLSGDKIKLAVKRGEITLNKEISLSNVVIPSIIKEKFEDVGYIKVSTFAANTADQFKSALDELEGQEIKSLVIDLRDNGGGYLTSASSIAKLFVEKDKIIYGLQNKEGIKYYKDDTKASRDYKIAVLVNSQTASASEILAAALKEDCKAILVGTKTYGKGSVQDTEELTSGGMVKYTTAYWLTPNGNNINGNGLDPDIEVNAVYNDNTTGLSDVQLQSAIDAVK